MKAQEFRKLRARVAEMEAALRDVRDNFDHDEDAHKYGTTCRCCLAEKALASSGKERESL